MSIHVKLPDKILAGLNQSYTVTTDEGTPQVRVRLDSRDLPHRLIPLGPPKDALESTTPWMKYKVSFLLPEDGVGRTLRLELEAGASKAEESKEVLAE